MRINLRLKRTWTELIEEITAITSRVQLIVTVFCLLQLRQSHNLYFLASSTFGKRLRTHTNTQTDACTRLYEALLTCALGEKRYTYIWLHPACPQWCKTLSGVQSALYFHTSVESDLHFKAARRATGERKDRSGRKRGAIDGTRDRGGPWLGFDLIFIKQENIKVKWIKVWIFVPSGHCRLVCLFAMRASREQLSTPSC